jgi:hypothetical protein
VGYARARSRYYGRVYRGLPSGRVVLRGLPPLTKPELMASFGELVADPAVTGQAWRRSSLSRAGSGCCAHGLNWALLLVPVASVYLGGVASPPRLGRHQPNIA